MFVRSEMAFAIAASVSSTVFTGSATTVSTTTVSTTGVSTSVAGVEIVSSFVSTVGSSTTSAVGSSFAGTVSSCKNTSITVCDTLGITLELTKQPISFATIAPASTADCTAPTSPTTFTVNQPKPLALSIFTTCTLDAFTITSDMVMAPNKPFTSNSPND